MLRYLQDMILDTVFGAFELTNNIYKNDVRIENKHKDNINEVQYSNSFTDKNIDI